jgi:hypothetical protein
MEVLPTWLITKFEKDNREVHPMHFSLGKIAPSVINTTRKL